jgi:hypothetical protein
MWHQQNSRLAFFIPIRKRHRWEKETAGAEIDAVFKK